MTPKPKVRYKVSISLLCDYGDGSRDVIDHGAVETMAVSEAQAINNVYFRLGIPRYPEDRPGDGFTEWILDAKLMADGERITNTVWCLS